MLQTPVGGTILLTPASATAASSGTQLAVPSPVVNLPEFLRNYFIYTSVFVDTQLSKLRFMFGLAYSFITVRATMLSRDLNLPHQSPMLCMYSTKLIILRGTRESLGPPKHPVHSLSACALPITRLIVLMSRLSLFTTGVETRGSA